MGQLMITLPEEAATPLQAASRNPPFHTPQALSDFNPKLPKVFIRHPDCFLTETPLLRGICNFYTLFTLATSLSGDSYGHSERLRTLINKRL